METTETTPSVVAVPVVPVVPYQPHYRTFWPRFGAYLIDAGLSIVLIPLLINIRLYYTKSETIGYRVFGLRITDISGQRASGGKLFGRFVIKLIFGILSPLMAISLIVGLFSTQNRFWHDKISGTVVVKEKPTQVVLAIVLIVVAFCLYGGLNKFANMYHG